jgi:hypothetical protein
MAFAALTGILDLLVLDDEHLGRLVVVLFGCLDADRLTLRPAFRASQLRRRQFVTLRHPAQLAGGLPSSMGHALAASRRLLLFDRRRCRLRQRSITDRIGEEQRLVGIDRGWMRTVQPPKQRIEPLLDLLIVAATLTQCPQQLGNHLFEDAGVVGECRDVDKGRCRCWRGGVFDRFRHWRGRFFDRLCCQRRGWLRDGFFEQLLDGNADDGNPDCRGERIAAIHDDGPGSGVYRDLERSGGVAGTGNLRVHTG